MQPGPLFEAHDDDPDLTNLIDLMVTIAAVLMLLLPTMPQRLMKLTELPRTPSSAGEPVDEQEVIPIVGFTNDGLTWDDVAIDEEELPVLLTELAEPARVRLSGARDAGFERGVALLQLLKEHAVTVDILYRPEEGADHAQ
jgi:biopolymer transport protein ExbD